MAEAELELLLSPIAGDSPCGADLGYDPAFLAIETAAAGKREQEWGDKVFAATEPDWSTVHSNALALASRTRDLRSAVWLVRSGARLEGWAAAVQGLQLLHGLVERHWDAVHPQLDATDNNDPTARVNALLPLVNIGAGLADLRAARLASGRGNLTIRDIELAIGHADAFTGETVMPEEAVLRGIAAALSDMPELGAQMQAGFDATRGLTAVLDQRLPAQQSPDLSPLTKLTQCIADAAQKARAAVPAPGDTATSDASPAGPGTIVRAGAISSRGDVLITLDRACEWIERNEPSHPAPLLIRRAQRLMTKSFVDIVRDIAPDGLGQLEKVAGQRFE